MFKCNHCNITFKNKNDEGILNFRGKMYCKRCEEPIVEIPDMPQATCAIHGAQATLISNSDNRITTNNYYGGGASDEQIDTSYGPCRKSEARLCKRCRQWVPLSYFNQETYLCSDCELKEARKMFDEGKSFFEIGLYDDAINYFQKYESIRLEGDQNEVKTLLGRCFFEKKEYKQALKYFVVASRSNSESQFYMGLCYYFGYGVTKDCVKAMSFFRIANEKRNVKTKEFLDNLNLICFKNKSELCGYKNNQGDVVIPCEWVDAWPFFEGLARVKDINGQYGFVDKFGKTVIPCEWKLAHDFDHDVAIVQFNDESLGIINKNGNVVSNGWKDMTRYGAGLFGVKDSNDKWGFMDRNGKIIIPFQWIDVKPFSQGLACVQDFNGMWGFVNNIGEIVIPCQWRKVLSFSQGLAGVQDFNGMWGYINNLGKVVIPCQWVKVEDFDKEGKAWVKDSWAAFHGHHINKEGNKYYV